MPELRGIGHPAAVNTIQKGIVFLGYLPIGSVLVMRSRMR
jgi:hypothetical protein